MTQLTLPMMTHYEGPRLVDHDAIKAARSYREAVRLCWDQIGTIAGIGERKDNPYQHIKRAP